MSYTYNIKNEMDEVIGSVDIPALEVEDALALYLTAIDDGNLRITQAHMTAARGGFHVGLNWAQTAVEGNDENAPVDDGSSVSESAPSVSAGGDAALADKPVYEKSEDAVDGAGDQNQIIAHNSEGLAEQVPDPQKVNEQGKAQRRAR